MKMIYKDLNEIEKAVFNNVDFILISLQERQGKKSLKRILNLLNEKYENRKE
jgi:hypothetical protein